MPLHSVDLHHHQGETNDEGAHLHIFARCELSGKTEIIDWSGAPPCNRGTHAHAAVALVAIIASHRIHRVPLAVQGPDLALPPRKRLTAHGLGAEPVELQRVSPGGDQRFLRLTIALDHRGERQVVIAAADGTPIGAMDIRYAAQYQPYDLPLPAHVHGTLTVRVDGTPLWVIVDGLPAAEPQV